MSYDLVIESVASEPFARAQAEAAIAKFPQLRRYDAESYRSAATELVLTAEQPGAPVENLTLHLPYKELPGAFDGALDMALGLAEQLGGRVLDAQLGLFVSAENRATSRAKAAEAAAWAKRLGSEFEAPPKPFVDTPAPTYAPTARETGRPWWKFWER
jgi:hypothetical protein